MIKNISLIILSILLFITLNLLLGPAGLTSNPLILLDVRLPRILMAILAGACLGVSGQPYNPYCATPWPSPDYWA